MNSLCFRWILLLILVQVLAPGYSPAQPPPALSELLLQSKRELYNLQLPAARRTLQQARDRFPRYPHPLVYQAYLSFIHYSLNMPNDSLAQQLLNQLDTALQACRQYQSNSSDLADAHFLMGVCYGIKGFYYGVERNYLKTYWYGRKGKGHLEKVVQLDSSYYDAYLGLGIFHYFAALLPGVVRIVAAILGFEGDRQKGIQEIRLTAQKGILFREEAWFTYAVTRYFLEGAYQEGLQVMQQLLARYPGNAALRLMIGYHYRRNGLVLQAAQYFQAVPDSLGRRMPDILNWKRYNLAVLYFMQNQFVRAEEVFRQMARSDLPTSQYLQAAIHFYLGLLADLRFQRQQALNHYRQIPKNNKTEYWFYLSRMFVRYPMDSLTYRWITADNLLSIRRFQEARRIALRLWADLLGQASTSNPNLKPLVLDVIARSYHYQNRLAEARREFQRLLPDAEKMDDAFQRSWIYIHYARLLRALGEWEQAAAFLKKAEQAEDRYTRIILARERHKLAQARVNAKRREVKS